MDAVREFLPKVFLLENVHGLSYSGKEEGIVLIERMTRAINKRANANYTLSWKVLNTANYGVPQVRERFFLVGHREGATFVFPRVTHSKPLSDSRLPITYSENEVLLPFITAWDAIGDLTPSAGEDLEVRGRWARLLPSIPEGENYLWHTNRKSGLPLFGWRTRYWSFLLKLAKDRPSWTIQAQPGPNVGPFHWKNRRLSVEEMGRLQTFPNRLVFRGGRVSIQRQIGNAVPSLMAEILAREIASQFFAVPLAGMPRLFVKPRKPIPAPEKPQPVPTDFLRFVGKHAAHPGEGMGRRAISRQRADRQQKQQLLL
jgi:DNA (cytosine-5)-methyltransferase 1